MLKYSRTFLRSLFDSIGSGEEKQQKARVVVWDNWTSHKAKEVTRFLEQSKEAMITISAYSPWLNPAESYISSIKHNLRKQLSFQRLIFTLIFHLLFELYVCNLFIYFYLLFNMIYYLFSLKILHLLNLSIFYYNLEYSAALLSKI